MIFDLKNDQTTGILVISNLKSGQNTGILVIFDLKIFKNGRNIGISVIFRVFDEKCMSFPPKMVPRPKKRPKRVLGPIFYPKTRGILPTTLLFKVSNLRVGPLKMGLISDFHPCFQYFTGAVIRGLKFDEK